MVLIIQYLMNGVLPHDPIEVKRMAKKKSYYTIVGGQLYKRGLSQPLLKCLSPDWVIPILEEVREGSCGHHLGGKALALKILWAGYYWATMIKDVVEFVKKMLEVPATCQLSCRPGRRAVNNNVPMAILQMGNWPPRSLSLSYETTEVFDCCHRLFHEVDRGRIAFLYHGCSSPEVCLEEHLHLIWDTGVPGDKQRSTVYRL